MKTVEKITAQKQADKRTALLALAINEKSPVDRCVTSEEMAYLLDKGFPPDKKQEFQEHLASCDICYQEWFALNEVKRLNSSARISQKIVSLFTTKKSLAIVGSTLAAAASLVVFLNIEQHDLGMSQKASSPPPIMEKSQAQQDTFQAPPAQIVTSEEERAVHADKAAPPTSSVSNALKKEILETKKSKTPKRRVLQLQTTEDTRIKRMTSEAQMSPYMREDKILSDEITQWQSRVLSACRQKDFQQPFWSQVTTNGNMLRKKYNRDSDLTLTRLLSLVTDMEKENMKDQCQKILRLLEEEPRTR